jgi:hypothetical protein
VKTSYYIPSTMFVVVFEIFTTGTSGTAVMGNTAHVWYGFIPVPFKTKAQGVYRYGYGNEKMYPQY